MRMVSSPGKSIRRRREICPAVPALAHRGCGRRPCRRPFQATAGPTTAAPPGVATAPDRRSCPYVRRAAVVASLALFGRRAARSACHCAVLARYSSPPLRVAALRRNSREIVDAARPSRRAISRMPWPCARHSAISSRSANTRYRSDGGFADGASVVGGMPPASRNQRAPTAGDTPASIAAASLHPPAPHPRRLPPPPPPQSPPRTAAGSPAAPRLVGQATPATRLVAPDPSAVSQPSSQPPPSRCCDDNLNPPNAATFNPETGQVSFGDISAFRQAGGKLLLYHGWGDPLVTPQLTVEFYEALAKRSGGLGATQEFARLFMVPGMDHCGIGTDGPGISDTGIDPLTALEQWVEEGNAPSELLATKTAASGDQTLWRRPVCTFPKVARYKGSGDVSNPTSFACAEP